MLSIKQINTKIGGIKKSTTTLHNNVQDVLVNVTGHALNTGDITGYDRLRNVLGAYHQRAADKWIKDNGLAHFDNKAGKYRIAKKARAQLTEAGVTGEQHVADLSTTAPNWWEKQSGGAGNKEVDVAKRIKSIITAMEKDDAEVKLDMAAIREATEALLSAAADMATTVVLEEVA